MTGQEREDILINYILMLFHDSKNVEYGTIIMVRATYGDELKKYAITEIEQREINHILHIMEHDYDLIEDYHFNVFALKRFGREVRREGGWLKHLENKRTFKSKPFIKRITVGHLAFSAALLFGTLTTIANWDKITTRWKKWFPEDSKLEQPKQLAPHEDSSSKQKADTTTVKH
jgi:hypothetical protein